jgi:hypothetical protein
VVTCLNIEKMRYFSTVGFSSMDQPSHATRIIFSGSVADYRSVLVSGSAIGSGSAAK